MANVVFFYRNSKLASTINDCAHQIYYRIVTIDLLQHNYDKGDELSAERHFCLVLNALIYEKFQFQCHVGTY